MCGYATYNKQSYTRHLARKTSCVDSKDKKAKQKQTLMKRVPNLDEKTPNLDAETMSAEEDLLSRTCPVCCKVFKNSGCLYSHRSRSTCVLQNENPLECRTCLKTFVSLKKRTRHERRNSCKEPERVNGSTVINNTNNYNGNTVNVVNNNQTNDNSTNITLNIFGHEKMDYITNDEAALLNAIRSGETGLQEIIKRIYFHKEHPENQTVQLSNARSGLCTVWDGTAWKFRPSETVTYDMMYKAAMPLHLKYSKEEEPNQAFESMRRAIQTSENRDAGRLKSTPKDRKVLRKLVKDTKCTLLNNRKDGELVDIKL